MGMTGLIGLPSAYDALHEADLVILLGADFPYDAFMPTKKCSNRCGFRKYQREKSSFKNQQNLD
ncbi:hypothetical protein ACK1KB_06015 [Chryseobacterium sp. TY3]